jgi:hypothetical protein
LVYWYGKLRLYIFDNMRPPHLIKEEDDRYSSGQLLNCLGFSFEENDFNPALGKISESLVRIETKHHSPRKYIRTMSKFFAMPKVRSYNIVS